MKFKIENMKCSGCVSAVTDALEKIPACEVVSIDLESGVAEISGSVELELVKTTLADIGYPVNEN